MHKDWWKWGNTEETKRIEDYPALKDYVEDRWKTQLKHTLVVPKMPNVEYPTKKKEVLINIFASLPPKKISFQTSDRYKNALGKSYFDVLRICKGDTYTLPDVVLYPSSHEEVEYIVKQAHDNNIALTPFGGGTNVVGALTNDNVKKFEFIACVNLLHMNNMLHIDKEHFMATFQAGILGPDLEKLLNKQGFTLGHFPQSFEYSTLGGWVVTRSAGQESTFYGKIEDLVEQVKVVTPVGHLYSSDHTHDASGVNTLSLFVGSEGTLGIVTEVMIKIRPLPRTHRWIVALFPSFELGSQALKSVSQAGIKPSVVRLSDANETMIFTKMAAKKPVTFLDTVKKDIQNAVLKYKNLSQPSLMMMRFEEHNVNVSSTVVSVKNIIENSKGFLVTNSIGEQWEHNRFKLPYLRDPLVEHGVLIDTYETFVPWKHIMALHHSLQEKLSKLPEFNKKKGIFMAHLSHIYPSGACIYFTGITPMIAGSELEQWHIIKSLITDTIIAHNGTISHHHGVGADHQKWYLKQTDPLAMQILRAVKKELDPKGILNPGKLFHV
jgi:alkyldihydroxyacetonephosphate synthase